VNYERIPVSKRSTHSRFTRNSEANSGNKPPICVGFWLLGYLLKHAEKKRFFDQKIQTTKFFEIIGFKKGYHYVFFRKTKHGSILAKTALRIITRSKVKHFGFLKSLKSFEMQHDDFVIDLLENWSLLCFTNNDFPLKNYFILCFFND